MTQRRARFRVTPRMLGDRLELPTSMSIVGAEWDRDGQAVVLEIRDFAGESPLP